MAVEIADGRVIGGSHFTVLVVEFPARYMTAWNPAD